MPNSGLRTFQRTVATQLVDFPTSLIVEQVTDDKVITLTFDDGPDPKMTPRLLQILKKHGVKATFFLTGERMKRYPHLVKKIYAQGHTIGGHGYSHIDHRKLSPRSAFQKQYERTENLLGRLTGSQAGYFRPPYGALTNAQLAQFARHNIRAILWSVDSLDWSVKYNRARAIRDRVLQQAHPGAIVLLHSGRHRHNTAKALPTIITKLHRQGYRFVTLERLIGVDRKSSPPKPSTTK